MGEFPCNFSSNWSPSGLDYWFLPCVVQIGLMYVTVNLLRWYVAQIISHMLCLPSPVTSSSVTVFSYFFIFCILCPAQKISTTKVICLLLSSVTNNHFRSKDFQLHGRPLPSRVTMELQFLCVSAWKRSSRPAWNLPVPNVQYRTPDDGQRGCPKHV
jgi:hypothetical protein